ncbi:hypothetical protein, partial [Hafnia paralvei]|uniref:hypothetical protein n=1 Tax=Hafnia paralvei TaxID=546367 RepID=UPI0006602E24
SAVLPTELQRNRVNEANNSDLICGCKAKIVLFCLFAYLVSKTANKYQITDNLESRNLIEDECIRQ